MAWNPEAPKRGALNHGTLTGYSYHGCRCAPCSEAARSYRSANSERDVVRRQRRRHQTRARELMRNYGLTIGQYEEILEAQCGVCAICSDPPSGRGPSGQALNVDHDHETGQIRGLLCVRCNRAIGLLRDNPSVVRRVVDYLERQP